METDNAISKGHANALRKKVEGALKKAAEGKKKVVVNRLRAFVNHVTSLISEGDISSSDGQELVDAAQAVINFLNDQSLSKSPFAGASPAPEKYLLSNNYPNPFNPQTTIKYDLPKANRVLLIIYNLRGKEVARPVDGVQSAGIHNVMWDASNVSSGIYFYRLQADDLVQTRKMIFLK